MRRRIFSKIDVLLVLLLIYMIEQVVGQQHPTAGNNSSSIGSLPALSERASSGVNSRYLSAASTASLAAATVAAAAAPAQGAQNQNNQNNVGQNQANNQDANRNFLLHQQQPVVAGNQQQQQQQQAASQAPQFNSPVQQQVMTGSGLTPVMSTTYTFNPLTGQFVPSDLSTGMLQAPLPPTLVQSPQQQPNFNLGSQQYGGGSYGFGANQLYGSGPATGHPQQQRFNPYAPVAYPATQLSLNQFVSQQQQRQLAATNQFMRRNGFQMNNRLNSINYGGQIGGQQQQQQVEEEGGYTGYQQDSGQFGSDSAYSNLPPSYPALSGLNQQQQSQLSYEPHGLSSSASSSILVPTSSSFNTAFSSVAANGQQQQDYPRGEQCVAADNRHGTCYQASECIRRGGTPMGKCGGGGGGGGDQSSPNGPQGAGSSHVCCLFDVTCGQFAAERFVYFRNPNYPNSYDQSRICRAKIGKLDKGVCQLRLDLLRFDVAKPTNGNCSQDMFVVSGQNENYVIPKICGLNDGQHYYVGVDESGVITLHMMMMGFYRRQFELLITQIPCRSDYAAPAHCLQYYMGTHGSIKSFNYDDPQQLVAAASTVGSSVYDLLPQQSNDPGVVAPYGLSFNQLNPTQQLQQRQQLNSRYQQQAYQQQQQQQQQPQPTYDLYGGYPNDLDYTMCIRKESGFCSITYQLSRTEQGLQPFGVGHQHQTQLNSNFYPNDTQQQHHHHHQQLGQNWQAVSTECRDDYLLIGGVRLCSGGGGGGSQFDPQLINNGANIQFAQNGSVLSSAGILHQQQQQPMFQQLQQHQQLLLQQLARIQQQQQQQQSAAGNGSYSSSGSNQNSQLIGVNQSPTIGTNSGNNNGNNLEQQQAAIMQQVQQVHQQMQFLLQQNNRYPQEGGQQQHSGADLQGAIITDTTTGPFILRFVSNLARNARGFQIDYRQNPCK